MKKTDHGNNFNLLRFVFASLVIISHVPELQDGNRSNEILTRLFGTISFGELAVDSFFLLSGFLIVKSWNARPKFSTFFFSRVLRIYPGFIFSSLLCAFIVGPLYSHAGYFNDFRWGRFIVGLIKLNLGGTPAVFSGSPYPALNGSMWTIPYEFQCYLLVLLCGLLGVFRRPRIWLSIFLFCAILYLGNGFGIAHTSGGLRYRLIMAFSAGGCFYIYRNAIPWKAGVALVSFFLFVVLLFIKPLAELALCLFWGYVIFYYAMNGTLLLKFNRYPDISYGVYLYAWPINKILLWHFPTMNVYAAMVTVFILSVLSGAASWYIVERPFMKLKKVFRQKA